MDTKVYIANGASSTSSSQLANNVAILSLYKTPIE